MIIGDDLELVYSNAKTEEQCTSLKAAKKLFGGNDALVKSFFARINALKQAETIKDIIVQPTFHFHKLENKRPYVPCDIDKISQFVRIVEIAEVSKHYE